MQYASTSNGKLGFAIHKITHLSKGKISAYYSDDGKLNDAERFDSMGRAYHVKRGGPLWQSLESIGRAWRNHGAKKSA